MIYNMWFPLPEPHQVEFVEFSYMKEIEALISETKDHTLFKLPPVSTFIERLKEIVERSKM